MPPRWEAFKTSFLPGGELAQKPLGWEGFKMGSFREGEPARTRRGREGFKMGSIGSDVSDIWRRLEEVVLLLGARGTPGVARGYFMVDSFV